MEKILVEYAAERVIGQVLHGCHFIVENPATTQCSLVSGGKVEKAGRKGQKKVAPLREVRPMPLWPAGTWWRTSPKENKHLDFSRCVAERLRGNVCQRDHEHEPIIGGRRVTEKAGHYPQQLAEAMLGGIEEEWNNMHYEANMVAEEEEDPYEPGTPRDDRNDTSGDYEDDDADDADDGADHGGEREHVHQFLSGGPHAGPEGQDPLEELQGDGLPELEGKPPAADRRMAMHLHNVTGL